MNQQLYIFDCLTGKLRVSDNSFMSVGAGKQNVFRVRMLSEIGGTFALRNGICRFFPHYRTTGYSINGKTADTDTLIKPNRLYLMLLGGGCMVVWFGNADDLPDFCDYDINSWYVYTPETEQWSDSITLVKLLSNEKEYHPSALITFEGLGQNAFRLSDMKEVAGFLLSDKESSHSSARKNEEKGGYRCPSCMECFRPDMALSIAMHPALKGDKMLGDYAMQRFTPTQYTAEGHPLDAMGEPCDDYACPYCHYKLLPFYYQMQHHHVAIIGAPESGKSYYLASLVHQMEREFPRDFNIPFRDANPQENSALNNMRIRLFYSSTPEEFREAAGFLQGKSGRKVYRRGVQEFLPNPYIYTFNRNTSAHSIVFYNAERSATEKAESLVEKYGLKGADAIFFVYDPTQDPTFRGVLDSLHGSTVPLRQQEHLLSDVEMYLRRTLNLPPGEKTNIPLAIIVSKSDHWKHLLGPEPLLPVVRNGRIRQDNIRLNSERVRNLLFNLTPQICTGAENLSANVSYFAVSSYGARPEQFMDELTGETFIAPSDGKLTPSRVTEPMLWFLNTPEAGVFPWY